MSATLVRSRRTAARGFWGIAGVVVFGLATVAAAIMFAQAPHVDSAVLIVIVAPFLVMAVVLAWDGVGQGIARLEGDHYRLLAGPPRPYRDVLAIGKGLVDGREVPVVALRDSGAFPVVADTYIGFADADADTLLDALRARVNAPGFAGIELGASYWAEVEAEADRAVAVVRSSCGREPLSRDRVEFGFPGLVSAVRLDYGLNDAGERVELLVRQSTDLALTAHGRRWLRQNRKRSADPATQVGWLFGEHTAEIMPTKGAGFDRLVVRGEGGPRKLMFNAEEPDRF
ncbi:MAG: hypothetical protein QM708_15820 [Propioniciclava sp.]|uniref:hypothetical protein n=1 Tax=Propioniciclava sp. TaxID=2038686 RepID=UPI0039E70114